MNNSLVKAVQFDKTSYIGDPVNTVRMFNELEVDELCFMDIRASVNNQEPQFNILAEICNECFMPLSYGGGVKNIKTAARIFALGFEKIILNTAAVLNPKLITEISTHFGSQAVVVAIDAKKNILGKYNVYSHDGKQKTALKVLSWAQQCESAGAGELLLTSMDKEGTWNGFDLTLTEMVSSSVSIPVIAHGGGGTIDHIADAIKKGKASAVGLGSMVVYQKKGMGVLVSFPDKKELEKALAS